MRQEDERRMQPESVETRFLRPIRGPHVLFRDMPRLIHKPRLALWNAPAAFRKQDHRGGAR